MARQAARVYGEGLMATRTICDGGCGATTDNAGDFNEFGFVRKKQYCDSCSGDVNRVYAAIDDLHTRLAEQWYNEHIEIRATYHRAHPNAELPDE